MSSNEPTLNDKVRAAVPRYKDANQFQVNGAINKAQGALRALALPVTDEAVIGYLVKHQEVRAAEEQVAKARRLLRKAKGLDK